MTNQEIVFKAVDLVATYVAHHQVEPEKLPLLIGSVVQEMSLRCSGVVEPTPAVSVEDSYTDDYIICLEDGKKVTLLKRYLAKHFDLTPEAYIEKWGLPEDYPMVTKTYSKKRSKIAKAQGLGKS